MVVVMAFIRRDKPPQWKAVCEPTTRAAAVLIVRDQWALGNPARIMAAQVATAA